MAAEGIVVLGARSVTMEGAVASSSSQPVRRCNVSKRRQKSESHLHEALSQVSKQLDGVHLDGAAGQLDPWPEAPAQRGRARASIGAGGVPPRPEASSEEFVARSFATPMQPTQSSRRAVSLRLQRSAAPAAETPQKAAAAALPGQGSPRHSARAGSPDCPGSGASASSGKDLAAAEQLEELQLQNAVLRRSLAMLQQSVVEGMKGNRGQYQGNGFFKQRSTSGPLAAPAGAGLTSGLPADDAADLEELRATLVERRSALKAAVAARDEALRRAEAAERSLEALEARQRELSAELAEGAARLKASAAARDEAERGRQEAAGRAAELEGRASQLGAELAAAGERSAELQRQLRELEQVREAAEAERLRLLAARKELEAENSRLREELGEGGAQLARLAKERRCLGQRALAAALGGCVPLRECFRAWAACRESAREAQLLDQISALQAELAQVGGDLEQLRGAGERAREEAEALRREAEALRLEAAAARAEGAQARAEGEAALAAASSREKEVDELGRRLEEARAEAEELRRRAQEAEERAKALQGGLEDAEARRGAGAEEAARELQEALERAAALEAQLQDVQEGATKAAQQHEASKAEAAAKAAALAKEADAAKKAAAAAREAEASSRRQRDELKAEAGKLEGQLKAVSQELAKAKAEADSQRLEAQRARQAASQSEKLARELRASGEELQQRVRHLEEASSEAKKAEELRAASEAAEREEMRLSLAEAKSEARSSKQRHQALLDEHGQVQASLQEAQGSWQAAERRLAEIQGSADVFRARAAEAIEEARKNIRIMVTAPKVSINVCDNPKDILVPFPFKAIKDAVQNDVMPKYSKVIAVAEDAGDQEIRQSVQKMVEELALTLQTKVHELMPAAEGTTNWDGFGAKCGGLGGSAK